MTHRFYLPACTRKQVVWMAFPSPYPAPLPDPVFVLDDAKVTHDA
jgi:hypothetical protein